MYADLTDTALGINKGDHDMEEYYYTIRDIQNILRIGRTNSYDLIRQPDFPKIKLGKKYLIPKSEFEKFMNRNLYKTYDF